MVSVSQQFLGLDKNDDGQLDFDEFKVLFQKGKTRMAERDIELLFTSADVSKDGLLDPDEFLSFLRSHKKSLCTSPEYGLPNHGPGAAFAPFQSFKTRAARKTEPSHHGPTILDGTEFQHSLRSSMHYNGSTFVHTGGHVLDHNVPGHVDSRLDESRQLSPSPTSLRSGSRPLSRGSGRASSRPSSRASSRPQSSASARSQSQGRARDLRGPERFFYDRSTYTGVHQKGGPSTLDAKNWAFSMRPSQHAGSTFTHTAGHPLDHDGGRHIDSRISA